MNRIATQWRRILRDVFLEEREYLVLGFGERDRTCGNERHKAVFFMQFPCRSWGGIKKPLVGMNDDVGTLRDNI